MCPNPQTRQTLNAPVPDAAHPAYKLESRSMDLPDEVKSPPHSKVEILRMQGKTYSRYTFYPGFRWRDDVGPLLGLTHCPGLHFCYQISGTLVLRMKDGTEKVCKAGEAQVIPPGHDGWVVGDEPFVGITID